MFSRSAAFAMCLCIFLPRLAAAEPEPIPVGVVQVLSGPQSKYGGSADRGIELAAAQINAAGGIGGRAIRLFTEDSAGSKDQAINGVRKLIGQDHVIVVIGPTLSTEMFAATPLANARGVPTVGVTATAKGIAAIGDYVFSTALAEESLIPASVAAARRLYGIKRAAILYANDDTNMKQGAGIFETACGKSGIIVADTEAFASQDTDFSAQLTKIASLGVDTIMVSAYPDAGASILIQARRLGIPASVHFIGGNGFNAPKLIELAGAASEGTIVSGPWSISKPDAANVNFVAAYKARFGAEPDQFAAQGYDGMQIVAAALRQSTPIDPPALRAALMRVQYDGVLGPFSFNASREPASSAGAVTFEVVDGKFEIVK